MKLEYVGNALLLVLYSIIAFAFITVLAMVVVTCGAMWIAMWQAVNS
jgi:hypothetical protein